MTTLSAQALRNGTSMIRSRSLFAALSGLALCGVASCCLADSSDSLKHAAPAVVALPAVAPAGSLYARLGGTAKVTAIVDETIDKVAANPRMNQSFDKVDLKRVKDLLAEQICSLTGGGCTY